MTIYVSFHQLVTAALLKHDNDREATRSYLIKKLRDPKLRAELVDEALTITVQQRIIKVSTYLREASIVSMENNAHERVVALGTSNRMIMGLDFPLMGGMPLRQGNRDQVLLSAAYWRSQGTAALHKAQWLEAIAAGLSPDDIVGDKFTDGKVADIWNGQQRTAA